MEEILTALWAKALDAKGDIDVAAVAKKIDAECWRRHRDAYVTWMRGQSVTYQLEQLTKLNRSRRSLARAQLQRQPFLVAAERLESGGDVEKTLANWKAHIGGGIQRPVLKMTGADHAQAAVYYRQRKEHGALHEAFHNYIAERVPDDAPADTVMSAVEMADLYRRITGDSTPLSLVEAA